jgi:hypothetical protein
MPRRVFFIGPMGDDYADHIELLQRYFVERLVDKHKYVVVDLPAGGSVGLETENDRVIVITPTVEEQSADIPTNVFHQIDNADLIIADLSGNRPAVVYELAFSHALGIETILVGDIGAKAFFYSGQTRLNHVDFKSDPWKCKTLDLKIDSWVQGRLRFQSARNPLHDFYQAPLLDISAASGLAAGFFENFARPILVGGMIVERRAVVEPHQRWGWMGLSQRREIDSSRVLRGMIVVRPQLLTDDITHMESGVTNILRSHFEGEYTSGKDGRTLIKDKHGRPRTPFFVVRDYVIDIPRTMFSLVYSRRLGRIKDLRDEQMYMYHKMQNVLIDCFFDNLKRQIDDDRYIKDEGTEFHVATLDKLQELIETESAKPPR